MRIMIHDDHDAGHDDVENNTNSDDIEWQLFWLFVVLRTHHSIMMTLMLVIMMSIMTTMMLKTKTT